MGQVELAEQIAKDVMGVSIPASVVSKKLEAIGVHYDQQMVRYHRRGACRHCKTQRASRETK